MNVIFKNKSVQQNKNHKKYKQVSKESYPRHIESYSRCQYYPENWLFENGPFRFFLFAFRMVHKINRKNRIHNKGNDQRCTKCKDEHSRQVNHEFTNDTRPEKQRN